ncbi:MAG: VOC family protein [Woeseiaceae bacterium]
MKQHIAYIALVVPDYNEAIDYYTQTLGFELLEDRDEPEANKRWVVIAPPGGVGPGLVLSRARDEAQRQAVGNQTAGRVFLFLHTDDFDRDYAAYRDRSVEFVRGPSTHEYGKVAVFKDCYGNLWDLIERPAT